MDVSTLVSLVTGAGGALVVLLVGIWLFITDKVLTTTSSEKLVEAALDRYEDMKDQRDQVLKALEEANRTATNVTESSKQALDLIRLTLPPARGPS